MRLSLSLIALLASGSATLASSQVVQKMGNAPNLKPGGVLVVRADCGSGRAAVSGGYDLTGAAPGSTLVAISDHPYSPNGQDWTGWSVTVLNVSDKNASAHLNVYAMCQ